MIDFSCGASAVEALYLGGNLVDGMFELLHSILFARQERNSERTDVLRKLLLQHRQCWILHRGDEDSLTLGEIVTDDVSNRVRFARAWGTLRDDPIGNIQQLNDADLLVVERLRKIKIACFGAARALL